MLINDFGRKNPVYLVNRSYLPKLFFALYDILTEGKGGMFSAEVKLRTRNEVRKFNGVVVDLDFDNNTATVWDSYAGDYRKVSFEGVKRLRTHKMDFEIVDFPVSI